ncbi:TadE/TadG family type IV pilus assembly protein [Sphingomonas sp. PB4P5]|uniref:TadE/TadG family type IV pilus assembly protein n=1 Tax=Parasphingomonas puruogangriensis TaxID=3096155 RepID=UPI002FC88A3D
MSPLPLILRRVAHDQRGLALIEFALALPLVLGVGMYGVETANLAIVNMRLSQIALNLADNASRVGETGSSMQQLRESDISDVLQATRLQGASMKLTTNGRVTLSSLEGSSTGVQTIHWQRCIGLQNGTSYASSYDKTNGTIDANDGQDTAATNKGVEVTGGMGDGTQKVSAPNGAGVMYVEINYDYKPLLGSMFATPAKLKYTASFIVRDNRDFTKIYESVSGSRSTCDLYTA